MGKIVGTLDHLPVCAVRIILHQMQNVLLFLYFSFNEQLKFILSFDFLKFVSTFSLFCSINIIKIITDPVLALCQNIDVGSCQTFV